MDSLMPQFTLFEISINIPPDQIEMYSAAMQQWMLNVPTLYFLDVCSISHIKAYLPSKRIKDQHHNQSIRELHDLDLTGNGVSYLSALMEKASDQRTNFNVSEFLLEARRDWDAMGAFFKNARVVEPWDFVESYVNQLFGTHPEELIPEYLEFLQFANDRGLHNKISERKRLKMAQVLCTKALELGISTSHPVVLVVIASIYGCEDARLVMKFSGKPGNFNPGNALGDIQTISRAAGTLTDIVRRIGASGGPFRSAKFKTADSSLQNLLRYLTMQSVHITETEDGATHKFTMFPDAQRLYPNLFGPEGMPKDENSQVELFNLYKLLGVAYSTDNPAC